MSTRFVMSSGTLEVSRDGKVVASGKIVDYEEADGWVGSERDCVGAWGVWTRSDGAHVYRSGHSRRPWFAIYRRVVLVDRANNSRSWKTAEAARRAVDREHPLARKELARG